MKSSWLDALKKFVAASKETNESDYESLEPRILYSGVPMELFAGEEAEPLSNSDMVEGEASDFDKDSIWEVASAPLPNDVLNDADISSYLDVLQQPTEIVFLDGSVENADQLLEDVGLLRDNVELVVLDPSLDGIQLITQVLDGRVGLDAIHFVTHGQAGQIQLGGTELSNDNLTSYASDVTRWGSALSSAGDILFYGCDLASDASGEELVEAISALTGADVAASDDLTGHAELGGDWEFEFFAGVVETEIAFSFNTQQTWHHTLDVTTALVAHYEFEENGGSTAADSTANNNNGTWINAPSWNGDAAVGSFSLDFTGDAVSANEVVTVPDDPSLDFSGDFSVAFWYNSSVAQANNTRIIGSHDGSDGFSIYTNGNGDLNFFAQGNNASITQTQTGGVINDGTWHHVVAVKSADSLRLYVDEYTSGVAAASFGTIDPAASLTIGGESSTVGDFEGKLDDVRVYTRALSPSDVGELYDLGVTRTSYSTSSGLDNSFEHISNVTFAGINNTTGADAGGYGDYTAQTASIAAGSTNTLSVTISPDSLDYVTAWVDWNQDFDFHDAGEQFVVATSTSAAGPHTVNIVAPNDAVAGNTRMRVSLVYNETPASFGTFGFGEVEDYTVTVSSLPTAINVDTTSDTVDGTTTNIATLMGNKGADGFISLREAIIAANNTAGNDTIVLSAGTYTLTRTGAGENLATTGDLDILSNITIIGAGAGQTTISASGVSDRVFHVNAAGDLTLSSLAIADGNGTTQGGAVENAGVLTATDVVMRNNSVSSTGGAIFNTGTVNLQRVSLYDNSSSSMGGAIYQTSGSLDLTNVTVSGNTADNHGGGAFVNGGTATVNHSTFASNSASFNTGGFLVSSGSATVANSIFADNSGSPTDISGNITSLGYNIFEGHSGFTANGTDIVGSDPGLAALTLDVSSGQSVHAFTQDRIAFDAAIGSSETTDQVGTARSGTRDIGAYGVCSRDTDGDGFTDDVDLDDDDDGILGHGRRYLRV